MKHLLKLLSLIYFGCIFGSPAAWADEIVVPGIFGQGEFIQFGFNTVGSTEVLKIDAVCSNPVGDGNSDVQLSCDGAAAVDAAHCFADAGELYTLELDPDEKRCRVLSVILKDRVGGPTWGDKIVHLYQNLTGRTGTATAGDTTSVTLAAGASNVDDAYKGMPISRIGSGIEQTRCICSYNGTTREAIPCEDFSEPFTAGTDYVIDLAVCETTAVGSVATVVDQINAITSQMVFTVAGQLDVRAKSIEDNAMTDAAMDATWADKQAAFNWRISTAALEAASYTGLAAISCLSPYGMITQQIHKSQIVANFWDTYRSNGTTLVCHRPVTTSGSADPIIGVQ